MLITNYYNDFFELGQQKINFSFFAIWYNGFKVTLRLILLYIKIYLLYSEHRKQRTTFWDIKGKRQEES